MSAQLAANPSRPPERSCQVASCAPPPPQPPPLIAGLALIGLRISAGHAARPNWSQTRPGGIILQPEGGECANRGRRRAMGRDRRLQIRSNLPDPVQPKGSFRKQMTATPPKAWPVGPSNSPSGCPNRPLLPRLRHFAAPAAVTAAVQSQALNLQIDLRRQLDSGASSFDTPTRPAAGRPMGRPLKAWSK